MLTMIKKPRIGICPDVRADGALGVHRSYFDAVEAAGGLLIMLPLVTDASLIRSMLEGLDGLILPGGIDVDAEHFGEPHQPYANEPNAEMDTMHITAAKLAIELEIPTLGICRGMQVLNIARGGTLYQDMAIEGLTQVDHVVKGRSNEHSHTVALKPEAVILRGAPIEDPANILVNTSHHQALKKLGEHTIATAHSEDGVIEVIEFTDRPQIIGVQWHPERLYSFDPVALYLFQWLIKNAAGRAQSRGRSTNHA